MRTTDVNVVQQSPRSKGKFVVLCGMDGSGKTTHARLLAEHLSNCGQPTRHIYAGSYLLLRPLTWLFRQIAERLAIGAQTIGPDQPENPLLRLGRKPLLFRLWPIISLADQALHFLLVLRPALASGNVICDRYFYDMLVGFRYHGYTGAGFERLARRLIPRPDVILILELEPRVAQIRETNGNHALSFYQDLRQRYRELASEMGGYLINTSDCQTRTCDEIKQVVDAGETTPP